MVRSGRRLFDPDADPVESGKLSLIIQRPCTRESPQPVARSEIRGNTVRNQSRHADTIGSCCRSECEIVNVFPRPVPGGRVLHSLSFLPGITSRTHLLTDVKRFYFQQLTRKTQVQEPFRRTIGSIMEGRWNGRFGHCA